VIVIHAPEQFTEANVKSVRYGDQGFERRHTLAAFDQTHRGTMQAAVIRERFL